MKTKLRNITVTLEPELAKWTRIEAARKELSVSRFLAFLLQKEREENDEYAASMKRALKRKAFLRSTGKYLSREEAHERAHLR
jgi:hypothetical protein